VFGGLDVGMPQMVADIDNGFASILQLVGVYAPLDVIALR
jgi:hypothetical protein